jgi:hypothetical protein
LQRTSLASSHNCLNHRAMNVKELPAPKLDSWGQPGNLTPTQQDAYTSFRTQVKESELDIVKFKIESYENASLRYLRARNFNVTNAIQLMNDCIKRKTDDRYDFYAGLRPEQCTECDIEALNKYYPHGQVGYDIFNRPILFEHSGAVDGHAIHQMTTTEKLIHYHWWSMETSLNDMFEKAPRKAGEPPLISTCVIIDLAGLNMHHCSGIVLEHVKAMVALDNVCYPEILGKMLVVNAPWLAVQMWEMVKSWLDPRTQQKIEIMRPDGAKQSDRLLQFITPEHLPVRYGGTRADFLPIRKHTEYLSVARNSAIRKFMFVPHGHRLTVDTYVTDGELIFEAYSRTSKFTNHFNEHAMSYPDEQETISNFEQAKFVQSTSGLQLLNHQEMKGPGEKKTRRIILEFPAETHDLHFMVTWSNTARMVTRPLLYSLTVLPIGVPVERYLRESMQKAAESGAEDNSSAVTVNESNCDDNAQNEQQQAVEEEQVVLEETD